ncbi:MAG: class I SAM-dependent methyltransferase [Labilithrix sp.]|nr:class I SAM-dependent methyltransferase [Labilithrix sp.]MBX3220858.1 class I SAM-dependent methyltransferase [Labilithrix sp.]
MNPEAEKARAPEADEPCPTCGVTRWTALFESRSFTIGRCARCGLVRTLGVSADGDATYPAFDQRETALVRAMRFAVAQLLRERARIVERFAPAPSEPGAKRRLLDVGCGSGAFARLMSRRGFDAVGVEPFSLGRPVDEPGLRLVRAPLERVRSDLGDFDVITMWHVLEHLDAPQPTLASLREHLRPGGVVVISVPNFESWQSRFFEGGWFHLDPPRHVTHFDHATLKALFAETGFEILGERTFHFEYGPVGWLQSALNRILPRKNFLYEFIKDRGALAGVPASQTALNLALSGAAGVALAAPSVVVEALAALKNAGSVITFAARPTQGVRQG